MKTGKLDLNSEEFKRQIELFELGLVNQKEIAEKWGVSNSYISNVFIEVLKGKPIKNKKKNDEKKAKRIKRLLENGKTIEEIMLEYPDYFTGENNFKRWVKINIGDDVKILNNQQKEKELIDKKIMKDIKQGYSTNVILKKYEITRSQLRAVLQRNTKETSLKKARENLENED